MIFRLTAEYSYRAGSRSGESGYRFDELLMRGCCDRGEHERNLDRGSFSSPSPSDKHAIVLCSGILGELVCTAECTG